MSDRDDLLTAVKNDLLVRAEEAEKQRDKWEQLYATERARAVRAEAQRDTLYRAASALWESDKIDETANEHWLALRAALAGVAPPGWPEKCRSCGAPWTQIGFDHADGFNCRSCGGSDSDEVAPPEEQPA